MFLIFFLVFVVVEVCSSYENSSLFSDKIDVVKKSAFLTRQSRLISFNTLDDDISIELDFSVPFISIPVKKSMALAQGSLANINVGAIILTGGLVVGVSLLMPLLLGFFSKQITQPSQWHQGYRSSDGKSEIWSEVDKVLSSHKIDPTSCMQKYVCSTIRQSLLNIEKGKGSSTDKIIDGISSSPWLMEQLQGTSMYFALKNGVDRSNCSDTYRTCEVSGDLMKPAFDIAQKLFLYSYSSFH